MTSRPSNSGIIRAGDVHAGDVIVAGDNAEYLVAAVKRAGGQVQIQPVAQAAFWLDNDDQVERVG